MAYNIPSNATNQQISNAVNYLLANFTNSVNANQVTGVVTGPGNQVLNYLYQYMDVMYAQSYDGSVGFSSSPTNATYYGLRNTNATSEDTNYTDYIWYETIGFGTTNFLWYSVTGGRYIAFYVGSSAPTAYYSQVQNNTPINLDILSGINTTTATIYIWGTTTAPARPTTMSTYTWSTGVISNIPAGWSATVPADSTPGAVLWSITINLVSNNTQATSTLDWTNTSYPIVSTSTIGTPGSSTFVVVRTADDGSAPTNAEVLSVIGRLPVAGDIATLNYNSGNNSEVFTYTGSAWTLFQTYITGSLIVSDSITASNINSNGLVIKDNSGNPILGVGTNLAASYINPASGWLNSSISIDGSGDLQGIGSGAGTTIANNQIGVVSGLLVGIGNGNNTAVANSLISINANGTLSGAGSGAVTPAGINAINVSLANAPSNIINGNISIDGTGSIQGIGTGTGTAVANNQISISASGVLSGAGGGSVSLAGLGAGAYAYLNQITSSNITTYIAGAAIGTAQVGVLTAANIGVSYLSAISANMGTITAGTLAAGTAFAGTLEVGSSPAISGTTMTGSGALINSGGTFALGNSTQNLVFNGSGIYLNGFVSASTTNATSSNLGASGGYVAISSFTPQNTGRVLLALSASLQIQVTGMTTVPASFNSSLGLSVYQGSTLIQGFDQAIQFVPCVTGSNQYQLTIPISSTLLPELTAGTAYTIRLDYGGAVFRDSSFNLISSYSSISAIASYNLVNYQPLFD
jgi:hypothetical protein